MTGRTFTTSPPGRRRRRTDGPSLTLIQGAGGPSRTNTGDVRPVHPAQDGFTPDGVPSDARGRAVRVSGPWSSPFVPPSRGSASLDTEGVATTGSGPRIDRGALLDLMDDVLGAAVGDTPAGPDRRIRSIR